MDKDKNLNVLIVDDEEELRKSVHSILNTSFEDTSFNINEAPNGKVALDFVKQNPCDLVIMDVKMPEMDGLVTLEKIKAHDPGICVLIMTAHSNLTDAVRAIKEGAFDYLEKPVEPSDLVKLVNEANKARRMVSDLKVNVPIFDDDTETNIVGSTTRMREIFSLVHKLGNVDTTVLIRGENGTGKEMVARAIHSFSTRKNGKFIAINCGAIPENLMESELFGHEKGSFTGAHERKIGMFQIANNGTLFLDEIAELKPEMQVKLLRVLQEKSFIPIGSHREVKTNARIIAATNQNLEKMIEEKRFREDLFYRLNVMPIFLPPLRERLDDIESLCLHFINKFNKVHKKNIQGLSAEAIANLKNYDWPGNIRELENAIERAFVISQGSTLTVTDLPENIINQQVTKIEMEGGQYTGPMNYDRFKEDMEKEFIIKALKANNGRINKTVAQANIPKNTLLRKIKKYEIDVKKLID
ncbi:MAG: sigma-54 dependent transcriptional regulator [Bdellovibrionaceae bacterium]|nr:sigma-54 dependent transcriptional regulator [Pseudobdellovibrionaceae bacterium]